MSSGRAKRANRADSPRALQFIIGLVAIIVVVGGVMFFGSRDSGSFTGELVSFHDENPASLSVSVRVSNEGGSSGNWRCTITASDPSGSYFGVDVLQSTAPLEPGESELYVGFLAITNEGAPYVTTVEVSDCRGA